MTARSSALALPSRAELSRRRPRDRPFARPRPSPRVVRSPRGPHPGRQDLRHIPRERRKASIGAPYLRPIALRANSRSSQRSSSCGSNAQASSASSTARAAPPPPRSPRPAPSRSARSVPALERAALQPPRDGQECRKERALAGQMIARFANVRGDLSRPASSSVGAPPAPLPPPAGPRGGSTHRERDGRIGVRLRRRDPGAFGLERALRVAQGRESVLGRLGAGFEPP